MVTYASLPSKSVEPDPSYYYSESAAGAVVRTKITNVTANTTTAYTIDYAAGRVFNLTLTGNCVYTFPAATAGRSFNVIQKQDVVGSRTVTWGAAVRWPAGAAPTITTTASKADLFEFTADGTVWYGRTLAQNYTIT